MQESPIIQTDRSDVDAPALDAQPYFRMGDWIFVFTAVVISLLVIRLGFVTWHDGRLTEISKEQGKQVAVLLEEQAHKQAGGDPYFAPCERANASWSDCRDALIAEDGPLKNMRNAFDGKTALFSSACDKSRPESHGTIIVEKGLPKPPDGSSLAYSPLADDESLAEPLSLRVSICGRGFATIHITEFTF